MSGLDIPDTADAVLKHIDEAIVGIEFLDNSGREAVMRRLAGWLLIGKYGKAGHEILVAFDKYCIGECLREDSDWQVPHYS